MAAREFPVCVNYGMDHRSARYENDPNHGHIVNQRAFNYRISSSTSNLLYTVQYSVQNNQMQHVKSDTFAKHSGHTRAKKTRLKIYSRPVFYGGGGDGSHLPPPLPRSTPLL